MSENDNDNSLPDRPSKSQLKRDMANLQKLGEKLVELTAGQLAQVPMDETLADAVDMARSLKNNEARRRQMQYIGRLMRDIDPKPIEDAIEKIQLKSQQNKAVFHQIERWRDRLIAEGDKQLEIFIDKFPHSDRQHLRQLVRNAQQAKSGADTELFRYIRQIVENSN